MNDMQDFDVMAGVSEPEQPHRPVEDDSSNLLVKFFVRPRLDQAKTEAEGRPIYRDVDYIDIRIPGSSDNVVRPATPMDKERFPRHYAAFRNRTSQEGVEGTLLSEWPMINRSQAEELAFFGVKTVEQLASMSDANGQQMRMGFMGLKRKAQEWLDKSSSTETLLGKIEARDRKIEELTERLERLETASKPKVTKKKVTTKKE